MSVEVTRLPSGLTVVTDAMPHLQSASLGVWVGSGSRDEQRRRARHFASARAHGVQGHARAAPRARSPRRSRRSAAISTPRPASRPPPITRACCKADVPLALDVLVRHPRRIRPSTRRSSQREQNVIVQEIGAAEDTPDDLVFDYLQATAFPGPADRPLDPRHAARRCARSIAAQLRAYLDAQLSRARHGGRGGRRGRSRRGGRRGRAALRRLQRARRRRCRSRRASAAARASRARDLEQVHIALALRRRAAARSATLQPAGLHQRARRRHVVAAVPGGAREARPLLLDLCVPRALYRHRHVRRLCRHRRRRRCRN